ncbi:MAG: NMD3-related protein [Nanoarchaeota archaeon]
MAFKKMCFSCGAKVDSLYEGLCEECYGEQIPPIQEIKPINLKICNGCGKLHYNNQLYEVEEIQEMLPEILEKSIVLNKGYVLEDVDFDNFEIVGHKVSFDVIVNSHLV